MKSFFAVSIVSRRVHLRALGFCLCLAITFLHTQCAADLIGHWTFESGSTADSTGHFGDLQLVGTAAIVNGELVVSRSGQLQSPAGWARTDGSYSGPTITSKTLVSWLTLTSVSYGLDGGSAMTLDAVTADAFDGIVFSELRSIRVFCG